MSNNRAVIPSTTAPLPIYRLPFTRLPVYPFTRLPVYPLTRFPFTRFPVPSRLGLEQQPDGGQCGGVVNGGVRFGRHRLIVQLQRRAGALVEEAGQRSRAALRPLWALLPSQAHSHHGYQPYTVSSELQAMSQLRADRELRRHSNRKR